MLNEQVKIDIHAKMMTIRQPKSILLYITSSLIASPTTTNRQANISIFFHEILVNPSIRLPVEINENSALICLLYPC